jgi:hypothetical protein
MLGVTEGEEAAMWRLILRTILAAGLLAGGIASLIYGARFHTAEVTEEQEIQVSILPPPGFGPPGFPGDPSFEEPLGEQPPGFGPPGFPGQPPFEGLPGEPPFADEPAMMDPPPFMTTVKEKVIVADDESELTLIREVTFGGVTLLASGELRRTYTGQPPSLCPT